MYLQQGQEVGRSQNTKLNKIVSIAIPHISHAPLVEVVGTNITTGKINEKENNWYQWVIEVSMYCSNNLFLKNSFRLHL